MESYGLEMDDLFDERDVSQDLEAFENDGANNQLEDENRGDANGQ